jgi:hypothetical protein
MPMQLEQDAKIIRLINIIILLVFQCILLYNNPDG